MTINLHLKHTKIKGKKVATLPQTGIEIRGCPVALATKLEHRATLLAVEVAMIVSSLIIDIG
jgi:hypothetical protein